MMLLFSIFFDASTHKNLYLNQFDINALNSWDLPYSKAESHSSIMLRERRYRIKMVTLSIPIISCNQDLNPFIFIMENLSS